MAKRVSQRLIAAAPELLAALDDAIWRITKLNVGGPDEPDPTLEKCKAAYRAATGKEWTDRQ
jgi:hypothetical protein